MKAECQFVIQLFDYTLSIAKFM